MLFSRAEGCPTGPMDMTTGGGWCLEGGRKWQLADEGRAKHDGGGAGSCAGDDAGRRRRVIHRHAGECKVRGRTRSSQTLSTTRSMTMVQGGGGEFQRRPRAPTSRGRKYHDPLHLPHDLSHP
eukprot:768529-Hanusia_phi.AAC.2